MGEARECWERSQWSSQGDGADSRAVVRDPDIGASGKAEAGRHDADDLPSLAQTAGIVAGTWNVNGHIQNVGPAAKHALPNPVTDYYCAGSEVNVRSSKCPAKHGLSEQSKELRGYSGGPEAPSPHCFTVLQKRRSACSKVRAVLKDLARARYCRQRLLLCLSLCAKNAGLRFEVNDSVCMRIRKRLEEQFIADGEENDRRCERNALSGQNRTGSQATCQQSSKSSPKLVPHPDSRCRTVILGYPPLRSQANAAGVTPIQLRALRDLRGEKLFQEPNANRIADMGNPNRMRRRSACRTSRRGCTPGCRPRGRWRRTARARRDSPRSCRPKRYRWTRTASASSAPISARHDAIVGAVRTASAVRDAAIARPASSPDTIA